MPADESGIVLSVHVQPRASKSEIVGWRGETLAIRLAAPPVEGAANRAFRDFLADTLGLKRADVGLVSGEKCREKRFLLRRMTPKRLHERVGVPESATKPPFGAVE